MKICAVNFSYSPDSMGKRGLWLLNDIQAFDRILDPLDYDLPVCNSNKCDGVTTPEVERFFDDMCGYDAYVFSVAEYSGAYPVGFKNVMDWFVVKTYYNNALGQGYPFSGKPVAVVTFTPTGANGGRHFPMTKDLIEKLGGTVVHEHVFVKGWSRVVPGNSADFKDEYQQVLDSIHTKPAQQLEDKEWGNSNSWIDVYNRWNGLWWGI